MTDRELLERLVEEVTEVKTWLERVDNNVTDIKADVKIIRSDVETIKAVLPVDQEAQNIATVRRAAGRQGGSLPLAASRGRE